mmetsp:Transcript_35566/g.92725  ORF Transcript_35566/g.92725 Transcript_35566/m.92725 type:complete len:263 (-) Transcript_35566:95-883(-)
MAEKMQDAAEDVEMSEGYAHVFPAENWEKEGDFYPVGPKEFCEDVFNFTAEYVDEQFGAFEDNMKLEYADRQEDIKKSTNAVYNEVAEAMEKRMERFAQKAADRVFRIPPGLDVERHDEDEVENEGEELEQARQEVEHIDDEIRSLREELDRELAARSALREEMAELNTKQAALAEIERRLDMVVARTKESGVHPITPVLSSIETVGSHLADVLEQNVKLLRDLKKAGNMEEVVEEDGQLSVPMPDMDALKGVTKAMGGGRR